ncbi:unnamed protein product [Cylicostephanus goldi]|uniref:Uncharacterized protein n=1 Tax=Cylicostephanus goldi TaxID=71465 RepID=A0A3P7PR79_CYLGO|nr:unnamed protein product [Cylicostephanus goldi]
MVVCDVVQVSCKDPGAAVFSLRFCRRRRVGTARKRYVVQHRRCVKRMAYLTRLHRTAIRHCDRCSFLARDCVSTIKKRVNIF